MEKEKEINEITEDTDITEEVNDTPEEITEPDTLDTDDKNSESLEEPSKDVVDETLKDSIEEAKGKDSYLPTENNTDNDYDITNSEEYTYKSRREKKGMKKKKKSFFKISRILIPLILVIVLLGAFLLLPQFLTEGKIASNVYSGNIDLGGLSVTEAEELIGNSYTQSKINFSVLFKTETSTKKASFTSDEIEFTIDPALTAQAAYDLGREENIFKNSWNVLRSFFTKVDIGIVPSFNKEAISQIFYNLGAEVHGEGKDTECIIENNLLTITPSIPGQSHNVTSAISEFVSAVRKGIYQDIPVTLKTNENDKLNANDLYNELAKEAKNAEYQIEGNNVIITDHVVGVKIDKAKLSALVEQVNNGIKGSIEVTQIVPEITKESLQESLFGTTLASYTSNYSTSSKNRAYNVELAASKINGMILPDGAEFSYNGIVGNANAANGFKMATVFSNGKVTEGIGGGVCQVSSTLYCAVLRADLEVTERHNHSLPISYVPGGQDATVAYGALDFRFKNNTGAPVKIVATSSNRNLTVSILGASSAKKKVEVTSQKVSSIAPTTTEIPDETLPLGTTKVISQGKSGSVYVTYKKVYDSNGKLVSETSTRSSYKATPGEIAVGTAAVPAEPTVTIPDTAEPGNTPDADTTSTEKTDKEPPSPEVDTPKENDIITIPEDDDITE